LNRNFFSWNNSKYTTRVAKTVKGAGALIEAGFNYVIDMYEIILFRKRK